MTDYVRVREGAWEYTLRRDQVPNDERVTVLDKNALAPNGTPAPPKPVTPLGEPAPGTKKARERNQTSAASRGGDNAGQASADPKKEI